MSEYRRVSTSAEVWAVIRARHPDLCVFESFSDPNGAFNGGSGLTGRMETALGFRGEDYPLIAAKTTWGINPDEPYKRMNERHEYWLCLPVREDAALPRYAVSVSECHPNHYGNMVRIEDCQALLDRALAIINEAILHGMPVTEEIAEVSNLIRGTKWSGDTLRPNS